MSFLLGLGLGLGARTSGSSTLNPATLSLTGYWKPSFTASPWVGTASAGSSSGREWVTGGGASAGAGGSIEFDGVDDYFVANAFNYDELFTRTAYFGHIVFSADTAAAPAAQPYNDELILGENGGNFYVGFSTDGVRFGHYDDVAFRVTTAIACSTSAIHDVQFWYDGTNLNCRIDGGSAQTAAAASLTSGYSAVIPRIGANLHPASAFFDGRIYEIITMSSVPDATTRDQLRAQARAAYGY